MVVNLHKVRKATQESKYWEAFSFTAVQVWDKEKTHNTSILYLKVSLLFETSKSLLLHTVFGRTGEMTTHDLSFRQVLCGTRQSVTEEQICNLFYPPCRVEALAVRNNLAT